MMTYNRNKLHSICISLIAIGLTLSGCQEKDMPGGSGTLEGAYSNLSFAPVVSGILDNEDAATKGDLFQDGASGEFPTADEFYVAAWNIPASGTPTEFITKDFQKVKFFETELAKGVFRNMWNTCYWNESKGAWWIQEYVWKANESKLFYAYAYLPEDTEVTSSLVSNKPVMTMTHAVPDDVDSQKDILLGYYKGQGKTGETGKEKQTGTASIKFSHPMTAVKLQMGTLTAVETFVIKTISVNGVYAEGTATMTETSAAKTDPKERFSWEGEGSTSVTQSVNASVTTGKQIGKTFILIPEVFGTTSDATIKLVVTVDGKDRELFIPLIDETWDAGYTKTYIVNYNGHEGIQLWAGGPYWATCNVGAETPEDYGWFFSWGNVDGYIPINQVDANSINNQKKCDWSLVSGGSPQTVKYVFTDTYYFNTPGTPGGELTANIPVSNSNDAAFKYSGKKWKMPESQDFLDLLNPANTTWKKTKRNGVDGILFTGAQEGYKNRTLFLPAAGYGMGNYNTNDLYQGSKEDLRYWTSTYSSATLAKCLKIEDLTISSQVSDNVDNMNRQNGCPIRPIEKTR